MRERERVSDEGRFVWKWITRYEIQRERRCSCSCYLHAPSYVVTCDGLGPPTWKPYSPLSQLILQHHFKVWNYWAKSRKETTVKQIRKTKKSKKEKEIMACICVSISTWHQIKEEPEDPHSFKIWHLKQREQKKMPWVAITFFFLFIFCLISGSLPDIIFHFRVLNI